jgi:hypothetical protein
LVVSNRVIPWLKEPMHCVMVFCAQVCVRDNIAALKGSKGNAIAEHYPITNE